MPINVAIDLQRASPQELDRAANRLAEVAFPKNEVRILSAVTAACVITVVPGVIMVPALFCYLCMRRDERRYIRNGLDVVRRAQAAAHIDEPLILTYRKTTRSLSIQSGERTINLLEDLRPQDNNATFYEITDEVIARAAVASTPDDAPLDPPAYTVFNRVDDRPPEYREQRPPPPAYELLTEESLNVSDHQDIEEVRGSVTTQT